MQTKLHFTTASFDRPAISWRLNDKILRKHHSRLKRDRACSCKPKLRSYLVINSVSLTRDERKPRGKSSMRFIRDNRCASLPSSRRAKLLTRLTEAELEVERKISWKVALNTVTKEICMYVSITSALTVSSEFHGIKSYPSFSLSLSLSLSLLIRTIT